MNLRQTVFDRIREDQGITTRDVGRKLGKTFGELHDVLMGLERDHLITHSADGWRRVDNGVLALEERYLRAVADELREDTWTPRREYACGCSPKRLCMPHADVRASDHYEGRTA